MQHLSNEASTNHPLIRFVRSGHFLQLPSVNDLQLVWRSNLSGLTLTLNHSEALNQPYLFDLVFESITSMGDDISLSLLSTNDPSVLLRFWTEVSAHALKIGRYLDLNPTASDPSVDTAGRYFSNGARQRLEREFGTIGGTHLADTFWLGIMHTIHSVVDDRCMASGTRPPLATGSDRTKATHVAKHLAG